MIVNVAWLAVGTDFPVRQSEIAVQTWVYLKKENKSYLIISTLKFHC